VGNMFYKKSSSAKTQNAEWGAKVIKKFEKSLEGCKTNIQFKQLLSIPGFHLSSWLL